MSVLGYPPYGQRHQVQERTRRMQWVRPDWLMSVEDAAFQYRFLGSAVPFSGDLRPTDVVAPNRQDGSAEQ